jgi:hypothetical protein
VIVLQANGLAAQSFPDFLQNGNNRRSGRKKKSLIAGTFAGRPDQEAGAPRRRLARDR